MVSSEKLYTLPCQTSEGCKFADSRTPKYRAQLLQSCPDWQLAYAAWEMIGNDGELQEGDCPTAYNAGVNTITFEEHPEIAKEELGFDPREIM